MPFGSELNGIKLSEVMEGFGWAVSVREIAHFMTWASEQLEVFRSPFFRSWFASSRSVGKSIQGDQPEHVGDEKRLFARLAGAGMDHFAPLPESIECSLEAEAS